MNLKNKSMMALFGAMVCFVYNANGMVLEINPKGLAALTAICALGGAATGALGTYSYNFGKKFMQSNAQNEQQLNDQNVQNQREQYSVYEGIKRNACIGAIVGGIAGGAFVAGTVFGIIMMSRHRKAF